MRPTAIWSLLPDIGRSGVCVLLLLGLTFLGSAYLVQAAPPGQTAEQGKAIFDKNCASCHTIGGGDLVGPDLKGVTDRRDREWLEHWLSKPDEMLAHKDPIATEMLAQYQNIPMPNQGLTDAEVEALLFYLEESGEAQPNPAPAPQQPAPPPGDPAAGKRLFTGKTRLAKGGSPCIACHTITGLGGLGGGTLGPDLTGAFNKYGDAGLFSVLVNIPFPTMLPTFGTRPLTPQEAADLHAFMKQEAAAKPSPLPIAELLLPAGGVAVALLALAHIWKRGRLNGVRRSLVGK